MNELCKVLIVDDEYIMRQGIKHLVNWDEEGFLIVGEASNGQEVLTLIAEKKPHIVLLDVVMPIIDGVELTKIIHEKYPEIKIIVLSGFDKFEYVKETLKNGAEDYILKPMLSPDTFLEGNYSAPRLGYINFWSKQRK